MSTFGNFCDGQPILDVSLLQQDRPELNSCFIQTVLVWVPHGYLWLSLVPYLVYLKYRVREPVLPFTKLQVTKCVLTVLLIFLVCVGVFNSIHNGYNCGISPHPGPALYMAAAIKVGTLLLSMLIEQIMRRAGVKTSGVTFVYWGLQAVAEIGQFYSILIIPTWCAFLIVDYVQFAIIWIQFVLRCFADHYSRHDYSQLGREDACPYEDASVLNHVTYHWMTPLIRKAYKETLTSKDLWTHLTFLRSRHVVPIFLDTWKHDLVKLRAKHAADNSIYYGNNRLFEVTKREEASETTPMLNGNTSKINVDKSLKFDSNSSNGDKGPSIFGVMIKGYGLFWFESCCYKLVGDVFSLLQPIILREIIGIIESRSTDNNPAWYGYAFVVAMFVTSLIKSIFFHATMNSNIMNGMRIKTALIGAIYRKAMKLNNRSKKNYTIGEIVNLMSVDCQRIQDAFTYSSYILSLFFIFTVAMLQLWWLMNVSMFGGLAVVILIMAANAYIGRLQQGLLKQILKLKGNRMKILNEVINGIKVLKMYTWEIPFEQKVTSIRQQEIKRFWKYALLTAVATLLSFHNPFMVNYVLVLIYTLRQSVHYLDAQTVFVALSLINILRGPIKITPVVFTGIVQAYVSLTRIQSFLWQEEINEDNTTVTDDGEVIVAVKDASFSWDRIAIRPVLKNINVHIGQGQLYAVVGQVGCGKTSLMSAILGEIERISGSVRIKGSMAYVPQEAWIQNLTVRDNILFSKPMDEARYNKVIRGCALLPDLEVLPGGDMTEIGEKGINISGGQKQRVSLARAVYSDADIYLLDDPLSAVDSHVGKHLFKNVIGSQGLLKKKTRVLVTHGVHWLPMVDRILVMKDGQISESGTYDELISRDGQFANFIRNYGDNDDSDIDDPEVQQLVDKVFSDVEQHVTTEGTTSEDNDPSSISTKRRRRRRTSSRVKSFGMSFSKDNVADDKQQKDQAVSILVQEETSQKGSVKFSVFRKYAKAMGYWSVVASMLLIVAFQSLNVYSNYWLTYWTENDVLRNTSIGHTQVYKDTFAYYMVGYTLIGIVQGVAVFAFGAVSMTRMVRATAVLHKQMLNCILKSPLSFFDTTPVGRIINRFSSDVDVIDDRLPINYRLLNIELTSGLTTLIVVSINTPYFMIVVVPVIVLYILLLKFFLPTARQIKRLESVLRSPIYNHFSETITGISVIRAYSCMSRFIEESQRRVDMNVKFFFAAMSGARWVAIRLEFLANLLIVAATLFALLSDNLNGAEVGLSIVYAMQITSSFDVVIQSVSEMEMNIVSAERVIEFTELTSEAPRRNDLSDRLGQWPQSGELEFRGYQTRYRPGLDLVLKGVSCRVHSGEKLGIVGRTGAGKSSLTLSLFRLIEAADGAILFDGQDISQLGLHDLRSKLTILPQDPVLFSGSLRENLDPLGQFDEVSMWHALECAHLKTAVQAMSGRLEYECGEGGSNLSMGQKQLVCLARTLLHKTRILILDEATAAVDLETDDLIQNTIRTEFTDCTILTIAHRLNTIMDYDRVLVLSDGGILELDSPSVLLQNKGGAFYKMAKDAGLVN